MICRRLDEAVASTPWARVATAAPGFEHRFAGATTDADVASWARAATSQARPDRDAMALLHAALALSVPSASSFGDIDPAGDVQLLQEARRRLAQRLRAASKPEAAMNPATGPAPQPAAQPAAQQAARLRDVVPVWVSAAAGALVATLLFIGLRVSINARSDPVFAALRATDVSSVDLPAASPALSPAVAAALAPRLATYLKQDIDAGLVLVNDLPDKSIVTIRSDSFFEPGSSVIADPDRMFPLMGRIAAGLNAVPGLAMVAGYTDSRPDHSVLYPSNWHLSQDRANVVTSILAESVDPHRLTAQGRADSQPVGDNATAQGRSDNRRVDITLVVGQPS
jgi:type VI secretion system protein ImpK